MNFRLSISRKRRGLVERHRLEFIGAAQRGIADAFSCSRDQWHQTGRIGTIGQTRSGEGAAHGRRPAFTILGVEVDSASRQRQQLGVIIDLKLVAPLL